MAERRLSSKNLSFFEKYLTVFVFICIIAGIILGRAIPELAVTLDSYTVFNVSIPIAIALFFMVYPIMVKIDFSNVVRAAKTPKPVGLTLFLNWIIAPFSTFLIATFFLGYLFVGFLRAVREALGMSGKQLAGRLNVSQPRVFKLEQGE